MGWNLWVEDANLEICTTSLHTTHVYANNILTKQPVCGWSLNGFVVGRTNIGSSVRQLSISFEMKDATTFQNYVERNTLPWLYTSYVGCVRTFVSEQNWDIFRNSNWISTHHWRGTVGKFQEFETLHQLYILSRTFVKLFHKVPCRGIITLLSVTV